MKHTFFLSPLVVVGVFLCLSVQSYSQPFEIKIPIWVTSGSPCNAETLYFGVTTSARLKTLSPDDSSCHVLSWCNYSNMDLHQYRSPMQVDTFCFRIGGSYLPVFHWQSDLGLLYDTVSMRDGFGIPGLVLFKANMLTVDSFKVTNTMVQSIWVIASGPHTPVSVNDRNPEIPSQFLLQQNYPNPFNPKTIIKYQLSDGKNVTLKVYDVFGREVAVLVDGYRPAGEYKAEWNADGFASGIYFYRFQTGDFTSVRKMILTR